MHDWRFLKAGDLLTIDNAVWRIDLVMVSGEDGADIEWIRVESLVDRKCKEVTPQQLSKLYLDGSLEIQAKNGRPQDLYPILGEQLDHAARVRLYYLESYDRVQPGKSTKKLKHFIDEVYSHADFPHCKPGASTLGTWLRTRGRPGLRQPNAMRDRRRRGPTGPREPQYALEVFEEVFETYLRSAR